MLSTAVENAGAGLLALVDVAQDLFKLCFGNLGSLVSIFVERVANLCCGFLGFLSEFCEKLIINGILYIDSRS